MADNDSDLEDELEGTLLRKLEEMGLQALQQDALGMLTGGELSGLLEVLDWVSFVGDTAEITTILLRAERRKGRPTLARVVERTRQHAITESLPFPPDGVIQIAYDVVDANAVVWAERRSAALVVQIAESMRDTIRGFTVMAVRGELTAQQLARKLARIIPLHSRYANAVLRREERLFLEGVRSGMTSRAAAARASRMSETYARKLTRLRARTIARTEIMTASNVGQLHGYSSAINGGLMSNPGSGYKIVTKEWITAEDERVCPVCGPMDKVQVDWTEAFGPGFLIPPAHPNCRCSWNVIDNLDQYDFDGVGIAEEEYPELASA